MQQQKMTWVRRQIFCSFSHFFPPSVSVEQLPLGRTARYKCRPTVSRWIAPTLSLRFRNFLFKNAKLSFLETFKYLRGPPELRGPKSGVSKEGKEEEEEEEEKEEKEDAQFVQIS